MKRSSLFPTSVLAPLKRFLAREEKELEERKKTLAQEDPFADSTRTVDNASPDDDAAEQFGHARIEAMTQEINRRLIDIRKALTKIKVGRYGVCDNCKKMIDTDRLMAKPEADLCINCEKDREK